MRKLLLRQGVHVPYATLHRFAVAELGFGRTAATVPIADCAPGEELQVDTVINSEMQQRGMYYFFLFPLERRFDGTE